MRGTIQQGEVKIKTCDEEAQWHYRVTIELSAQGHKWNCKPKLTEK